MTPKIQRIGIAVIAAVMVIGTLGSFAVMIIANNNMIADDERAREEQAAELQRQQEERDKLFPVLNQFASRAGEFDAGAVGSEVTFVDLKEGDGAAITEETTAYNAFYIGWLPNGHVFESSIVGESLNPPLEVTPIYMLEGWNKGVQGMKLGGIREITIPSDLAYGEKGSGDSIPPNTPLRFIVMPVAQ